MDRSRRAFAAGRARDEDAAERCAVVAARAGRGGGLTVMDPVLSRLAPVRFGPDVLHDLGAAERREWWLANGRGAYAAGTTALDLTRRYHGLLVAPIDPPLGRAVVLAKADATLTLEGVSYPLFTNRWGGGAIAPEGHRALEEFRLDGTVPVWRFRCGDAVVEHRIWLEPGADTVY